MTVAELPQPRVEPKRDRYGRYLIPAGGKHVPYTRATTIAGTIEDRYNLELWKIRMAAVGLTNRPDLYAQIAANHDDKKKLNAICDDAIEAAKGSAGANLGTALHTFTERVDLGETITIPPPWDADVAAYTAAMAKAGVTIVPGGVEKIVVLHDLQVAGTFDRLVTIGGRDLPLIADLKTGAGLDFSWGSIAIQLALYAHADEVYDPVTDTTSPMPAVDQAEALVMHLPAGEATCTLYLVDVAAGWDAVQTCMAARSWRTRKNLNRLLASVTTEPSPAAAPAPAGFDLGERRAYLVSRIELLRSDHPAALDDLAAAWPLNVPTFKSDHQHTAADLELIAAAIAAVEAKHLVEFVTGADIDPAERPAEPEEIDRLVARLKGCPADIAARVAAAVDGKVPHLRSGVFTVAHAALLEPYIVDAERLAAASFGEADALLQAMTEGDVDLLNIVLAACGTDRYTWTQQQLTILRSIHAALDACTVGYGDGALVPVGDGEKRLIDVHGDRKTAVDVCKQIAEAHGLDKPRLLKDVVGNPALFALAVSAPTSPSISEPRSTAA